MIIDFTKMPTLTRYHVMTQTIVPRPIAWVLSQNEDKSLNVAPFSFFNAVCSNPPLLMFSVGRKSNGEIKDTRKNVLSGRPFIIHIASVEQAKLVNNSAAELSYGDSEVPAELLTYVDFTDCPLPIIAGCKVAYCCELYSVHEIGPNKQAIIYAEIKQLYLENQIVEELGGRYSINSDALNPLVRLGGSNYSKLDGFFSLVRPNK